MAAARKAGVLRTRRSAGVEGFVFQKVCLGYREDSVGIPDHSVEFCLAIPLFVAPRPTTFSERFTL